MNISYVNSKAVKINSDMRNDLNFYNQRQTNINNYSDEITANQKLIDEKNAEITSLQGVVNSDDKRESKEASRKIKNLQKDIERLEADNRNFESKKNSLVEKQVAANTLGVQMKSFPNGSDMAPDIVTGGGPMDNNITSSYNEQESFVPASNVNEQETIEPASDVNEQETIEPANDVNDLNENTLQLSSQDIEAIWNGLHQYDAKLEEMPADKEPEQTVEPVYTETTPIEPVYDEPEEVAEAPKIIEPIVINEEPINVDEVKEVNEQIKEEKEGEETTMEYEEPKDDIAVNSGLEKEIHEEVKNEFPKIVVPEPMDSENKLHSIYNELEVEPKAPDTSTPRDLKNLTLFVDYNDYTFAFAQQHYDKEALTPDEIENLTRVKGYLTEKDFSSKRTIQYNKITAENKRLNKKIVSLSKEFTKTIDKLSKEYVSTTEELTNQTLKATEQIEIDRVEKVQTQRLNESLTNNIKEQASHIEDLMGENKNLKETIDARDNTIKDLEKVVSDQADKIKVFEEKLNTVLGIVKEVKGEKKNANKE